MHHYQRVQQNFSQADLFILICLVNEPKTATVWYEAVIQATGQVIEPGAFSRMLARLEQRGWIEALQTEQPLRLYQITAPGLLAIERAETHQQGEKLQEGRYPHWLKGREIIMRLVLWMLRLYPPAWRERYEAEMVVLLEQHAITFWTVLDLLVGALDARLDPHYRRARQLLPLRRFQSSWRLLVAGFVVFWIALLPWFWMSQIGLDDADCSTWGASYALCVLRKTLGAQQSALGLLVGLILIFLPILLMLFITMLVVARGKGTRIHLQLARAVTWGMIVLCIFCGFWLAGMWQLLPQISQFYPQTPAGLIIGIGGMGLSTVLALGALAASALRDMEQAAPQQEAPLAGAAGLSSRTSEHQQDDRYVEARSAEESEGEQQEMPMVLRAVASVREEPATSFAEAHGTRKGTKGEWVLLVGLMLLFIVPWPALISGNPPDHPTLLFSWLLAVVVSLITAWLVKEPGKKWEQRTRRKPRWATSPLWWAALLPAPAMTFFIFGIGSEPRGLPLLLAGLVSGATALIVKIRMGHPHIKSPVSLGVLVLATIFMVQGVSQAVSFPFHPWPMLLLINLVSIVPAFFVRVPTRSQQVEGASEPQDRGAGEAPKVVSWVFFILTCNAVYAQVSTNFYLNQGQYPLPPWAGWNEMLMSIVMVICLIPALVVKIQTSNRWAAGMREPVQNDISPKMWILVLPMIFLMFVTQMAYIIGSDAGRSFANVFISWLLTGVAALIMLLAIRLSSRKRMAPPMEQARIQRNEEII